MPRQLPWKVTSAGPASPAPPPRRATNSPSTGPSPSTGAAQPHQTPRRVATPKPRRSLDPSALRSPSTSPPPEPVQEEFMIPGPQHDDAYRMVEDEFQSIAHEFTRHLHAAEYQRLRNLAKEQGEQTLRNIERPVVGEMSVLTKRRHAALGKKRAIAEVLSEEEGAVGSVGRGSGLQGLMDSPRKSAPVLQSIASFTAGRSFSGDAGRGGGKGRLEDRVETESEDDGDLDGPFPLSFERRVAVRPGGSPAVLPGSGRAENRPAPRPSEPRRMASVAPGSSILQSRRNATVSSSSPAPRANKGSTAAKSETIVDDDDDYNLLFTVRPRDESRRRRNKPTTDRPTKNQTTSNVKTKESDSQTISLEEIPFI